MPVYDDETARQKKNFNSGRHYAHISGLRSMIEGSGLHIRQAMHVTNQVGTVTRQGIMDWGHGRIRYPRSSDRTRRHYYRSGWEAGVQDVLDALHPQFDNGSIAITGPLLNQIHQSLPIVPSAIMVGCADPRIQLGHSRLIFEEHLLRFGEFSPITNTGGAGFDVDVLAPQHLILRLEYGVFMAILAIHESCKYGPLTELRQSQISYGKRLLDRGFSVYQYLIKLDNTWDLLPNE